jgi:hypothetical protein
MRYPLLNVLRRQAADPLYRAVNPEQGEKLESLLLLRDWKQKEVPYARFSFVGPKVQVTFYTSESWWCREGDARVCGDDARAGNFG